MWRPGRLNNGEPVNYGLGWALGDYRGHRYAGHGGGTQNWFVRFLDEKLTVALLAKTFGAQTQPVVLKVASYYLQPQRPIEDENPRTTSRLKTVVQNLAKGEADPAWLAADARVELLPRLKLAKVFYEALGPVKSFDLIERQVQKEQQTYRYRVSFRDAIWHHTFVLVGKGDIAEVSAEPE